MCFNRFKKLTNLETKNYLRFAIVEVILVVAGILIALQVIFHSAGYLMIKYMKSSQKKVATTSRELY